MSTKEKKSVALEEKNVPVIASQSFRRLDPASLVLFLTWLLLLASVGEQLQFVPRAFGLLGGSGASLARLQLNALGCGVVVFLLGWICWLGMYICGQSKTRLLRAFIGWSILGLATAVLVDLDPFRLGRPMLSVFGPGGSIGACGRIFLEDILPSPLPVIILSLTALFGWILIAASLVRLCGTIVVLAVSFGATVAERLFWAAGELMLELRKAIASRYHAWATRERPVALVPASADAAIPIIRHTLTPEEALAELDGVLRRNAIAQPAISDDDDEVAEPRPVVRDVPIHRHRDLAASLSARDTVVDDDEEEPAGGLPEGYELPSLTLLAEPDSFPVEDHALKLRERALLLEKTFADFGLTVRVVGIHTGPVITQYEMSLETGLRLNKVTTLADDIALNLGVSSVRIVAPLPGRSTVGIEVPNEHRQTVRLKELMVGTSARWNRMKLPVFLGKDVEGRPLICDMADMPHLLIAGRTGTGKSVCLNSILNSFLFTRRPDECRLILIDPKKVEFSEYGRIPHLMHPVVTDDKKAEAILAWAVDKMEERYGQLQKARVRNVSSYNELGWAELVRRIDPQTQDERNAIPRSMPYIVVVVDEVGDLLMTNKKEVEAHIIRLAQKSRAAGIHLILATQKPTVDVITGLIKSNLPARICFQVASRADSAVVLDEKGAEKLLGQGDMLFLQPRTSTIIRGQGAYVDDREIERVTAAMAVYEPNFESELLNLKTKDDGGVSGDFGEKLRDRDPMYEQAIEVVIREQRGSTSLLQRALGIGYGRASRLIDFMAEDGIVGGYNGSNARDVIISAEEWEARRRSAG